jgi:ribosomal-protein-alanine N-acetyltransferase
MMPTIRKLGALDLDVASKLHGQSFAPLGERAWSRQDVAELLASPGVQGFVLDDAGGAAGFALWRIAADESELLTIAVDGDRRRRGGGLALLTAVIAAAREAGAVVLILEVGEDNPAALALYRRAGFSTVGRRQAYYERGKNPRADAVVMRLVLASDQLTRAG